MKRLLTTTTLLLAALFVCAQTKINGVVKDRKTGRPLAHVNVSAEGTDAHTVTNDDGRFLLKTPQQPHYIQLSHIGYKTRRHQLRDGKNSDLQIALMPSTIQLEEIIISADDPLEIIKAAMSRIEHNYPDQPELMRCFYRETARRGSRFISIAEAVTDMYKTGYAYGPTRDAVAILKGRRLMSMKARDTLGVKIQGGPVMPLMADVAKNPEYVLNPEMLNHYSYHMEPPTVIDDQLHYVITMTPSPYTLFPLMGGRLFINQQSLTISRAELELDVRDWQKASDYMLVNKPAGLRFRPKELTMTIVYETDNEGITRLRYLRNEMRFNCDWKRRLFAHTFTTVSEMVVTERLRQGKDIRRPRGRASFGIRERFYDKVEYFEDPDFWSAYNVIKPTESLEDAISKLKKRVTNRN